MVTQIRTVSGMFCTHSTLNSNSNGLKHKWKVKNTICRCSSAGVVAGMPSCSDTKMAGWLSAGASANKGAPAGIRTRASRQQLHCHANSHTHMSYMLNMQYKRLYIHTTMRGVTAVTPSAVGMIKRSQAVEMLIHT